MTDETDSLGGLGGALDMSKHNDRKLAARSAHQRWGMPRHIKDRIVERLYEVVDQSTDERNVNGAARTLVAMEGQNQTDEIESTRRADAQDNETRATILATPEMVAAMVRVSVPGPPAPKVVDDETA